MSQKSSSMSYLSEQNPRDIYNMPQKPLSNIERHLEPNSTIPSEAQKVMTEESCNDMANVFDLAPLSVFCGKKNLPPRPLSGKHTKKQMSDSSAKDAVPRSQHFNAKDVPVRDENFLSCHSMFSKGSQDIQSPLERIFGHSKKKSSDTVQGAAKREPELKDSEEQMKSGKSQLDGKILKRIMHKVSGSNPNCLNTSTSSFIPNSPEFRTAHSRNSSSKDRARQNLNNQSQQEVIRALPNILAQNPNIFGEPIIKDKVCDDDDIREDSAFDERVEDLLSGNEKPSDFFNFYKGEIFDFNTTPFSTPKDPNSEPSSAKEEEESINFLSRQLQSAVDDNEEIHPWLIPNIQRDPSSQNLSGMAASSYNSPPQQAMNSNSKPANASFLSCESTLDSDQFNNYDFGNTSLSANSNSFYNSRSNEHVTPTKMNSFRRTQDAFNGGNQQYMPWMNQQFNTEVRRQSMISQRKMPSNLNHSAIQFSLNNGSGSERSSLCEDLFNSNWSTPQGQNQQQFINPSINLFHSNNYNDQMQPCQQQNYSHNHNQSMVLPGYHNTTPNGCQSDSKQRQSASHQKIRGRNQKRIPDNDESSMYYEILVDRLHTDQRTTLMIKNIPNKYDQPLLLQTFNKTHQDKFDFFYLPIDFKNKCNVGYAFINFVDPRFIKEFYEEFNGKKWKKFNSEKICKIKYGRIQGLHALVQHFEASSVMNQQDKKLKPLILCKNSKTNMIPRQNFQNIEQLVRQQKATLGDSESQE